MLNGLDLFSGIGGIAKALEPWVQPIAYCEIDPYCRAVLLSRMRDGGIPIAPIWDDVRTLLCAGYEPAIDIISGGFPCQDISLAGNGAGLAGERSGLVFEVLRLVSEIRPSFVFLENVPAIRTRGADVVTGRLAELGYDCRWGMLSAFDVGAPHKRERWWLLAHSHSHGREGKPECDREGPQGGGPFGDDADGLRDAVPYSNGKGLESGGGHESELRRSTDDSWWAVEPDVGRVAHGIPQRVDRIKSLGNSWFRKRQEKPSND